MCLIYLESKQGLRERHLLNRLLRNYDPLERPVALETQALNVTFGLTLQQIIDVVSMILKSCKILVFILQFSQNFFFFLG